jgi:hypothetical protein
MTGGRQCCQKGMPMNRLHALGAALLSLTTTAEANDGRILRGLFCNTRAQLEEALLRVEQWDDIAVAVEMTNLDSTVCTYAHRIGYMVLRPVALATRPVNGNEVILYRATLVGVLVGDNPRPVMPPLETFFITMDPVPSAAPEEQA